MYSTVLVKTVQLIYGNGIGLEGLAMKNILEYLENTALRVPDKAAAKDEKTQCTYSELLHRAKD